MAKKVDYSIKLDKLLDFLKTRAEPGQTISPDKFKSEILTKYKTEITLVDDFFNLVKYSQNRFKRYTLNEESVEQVRYWIKGAEIPSLVKLAGRDVLKVKASDAKVLKDAVKLRTEYKYRLLRLQVLETKKVYPQLFVKTEDVSELSTNQLQQIKAIDDYGVKIFKDFHEPKPILIGKIKFDSGWLLRALEDRFGTFLFVNSGTSIHSVRIPKLMCGVDFKSEPFKSSPSNVVRDSLEDNATKGLYNYLFLMLNLNRPIMRGTPIVSEFLNHLKTHGAKRDVIYPKNELQIKLIFDNYRLPMIEFFKKNFKRISYSETTLCQPASDPTLIEDVYCRMWSTRAKTRNIQHLPPNLLNDNKYTLWCVFGQTLLDVIIDINMRYKVNLFLAIQPDVIEEPTIEAPPIKDPLENPIPDKETIKPTPETEPEPPPPELLPKPPIVIHPPVDPSKPPTIVVPPKPVDVPSKPPVEVPIKPPKPVDVPPKPAPVPEETKFNWLHIIGYIVLFVLVVIIITILAKRDTKEEDEYYDMDTYY